MITRATIEQEIATNKDAAFLADILKLPQVSVDDWTSLLKQELYRTRLVIDSIWEGPDGLLDLKKIEQEKEILNRLLERSLT